MVKIKRIFTDDASGSENGTGYTLDVDFDNGQTLLLTLDPIADKPLFYDVVRGKCGKPETDGVCVFWPNGASLSLQEMFGLMLTASTAQ